MPRSSSATRAAQVLPDVRRREILSGQIRLLYANANVGVGVTILTATILGLLQWPIIPHSVVGVWWFYMTLVAVFRCALARGYRQASPGSAEIRRWRAAFTVGAGLAGAGWGGAGILLYPEAHLWNQVFLVFVLGGMMLGAASLLAPRPEAFLAFQIPTGLGPALRLLVQGDQTHFAMGLLATVFTLAILVTTWRIYCTIDSSLRLQFKNRDLLKDLHQSTEHLGAEVAQRKQVEGELSRAQRALLDSEKLAATARLAATMAHEINNPLEAITNLTFLLSPLQTSPEARAYLATLEQQVKGLSRIATQMLKFHRDSNQPTEFRLSTVLCEIADFYHPQAERQGVIVNRRIETEGLVVGFRGEIVQVVTNLLLNALEATPVGGEVSIHLYLAPPWLCEVHDRRGYCLSIADSGTGIEPQNRAHIFKPFFTTKGDKGSGLGLWVCRGLINRVGGSIRVWSAHRPGHSGTCFSIFLPAEVSAAENPRRRRYEVIKKANGAAT
jgi:signal transduction histidine kinase